MAIPKVFSGRVGTPIDWPDSSSGGVTGQLTDDQLDALVGTSGAPAAGNKFVTNSDPRLSSTPTPTPLGPHAPTHKAGGSDLLLLDELGAPPDRALLDATPSRHGLLPKLSGSAATFLSGTGNWGTPLFAPTPTGTGFRHVTVDIEDPIVKLVENADVAALAAIVESKLSLNFPTHAENHAARHLLAGGDSLLLTNNEIAVGAAIVEAKLALNFATHAENHAARHGPAPAVDPLRLDDLEVPQNNTDLNVSISAHGLCPLLPNNAAVSLSGAGTWVAAVPAAHASTHGPAPATDPLKLDDLEVPDANTDLNATAAKHGLLPMLSNVATQFLNGLGGWTAPASFSLEGSAYIVIGGDANSTTNGTALVNAYTAATGKTPHGAALSATNRYTIYLLPGIYTLTASAFDMSAQFIDIVGIGGTPKTIIVTSNGRTLGASANDIVLANFQIHTSVAGTATLNTDAYAFYPGSNLTGHKCLGMVFNADDQTVNRGMRCGITYSGIYTDCISATDRGFGCWCGTTAGVASGYFVRCESNRMGFGMGVGSTSAAIGTASGVFWKCRASGGFAGNATASGYFNYCLANYAFQNAYANCQVTGDAASFGGGNSGASLAASGTFLFCSTVTGPAFGFNIQANAGAASGTFRDCHCAGIRAFGSTLVSGTLYNCTALGTSFGSGTSSSITGQLFNCSAYGDTAFAGGGGSMSAAAVLVNCYGQNYCFTGRNGGAGGAIAGLLIGCLGSSTCFASGTSGGAMSGTLSDCRCSAAFNATLTGSIRLCDFPTGYDNLVVTALNPAADVTAFTSQVTTNINVGSAVGFYGVLGSAVHSTTQALTMNAMTSSYAQAGLVGCKGNTMITAAATVTSVIGFGVQNLIRGGCTVTHCIGLLSTPFYNDAGAGNTVDSAYGLVVKSCVINVGATLNNVYGVYLADQLAGTNRWGVYQLGTTNYNLFQGKVTLGVASSAGALGQSLDSGPTSTITTGSYHWGSVTPIFGPGGASNATYVGLFMQPQTTGVQNFTGSVTGLQMQALHYGTGVCTLLVGGDFAVRKVVQGAVTTAIALRTWTINANATAQVGTAYGLFCQTPLLAATGFITTNYGVYIDDQKPAGVTTAWGVYQVGATTLNYFAGFVGVGTSPSNLLHVAQVWTTTAATGIMTYDQMSAAQADGTGTDYIARKFQLLTTTASNFSASGAGYGLVGLLGQVVHAQNGTATLMTGAWIRNVKNGTGVVTASDVLHLQVQNNAANALTTNRSVYVEAPLLGGGGTIGTNYGVYIADQTPAGVSTGYGIYQVGATTLNYFAGKVGVAMTPTNTLDVTGTFGVTSTATIGGLFTMSSGIIHVVATYSAAGALAILTSHYCVLCDTTANDVTCNLPTAVGISGRVVVFKKLVAANNMRIIPNGAETIDGAASYITAVQWNSVTLISNGANWFLI